MMGDKFKYNLLSTLSFLISFFGFIGFKLVIVGIAVGFYFLVEKYLGDIGMFIGYLIGLIGGGLVLIGFEYLSPYLERLDTYTKTLKKYPYTEKYGKDYPKPEPKDFGITPDEFKDYNSRFQFDMIKFIFTYGIWLGSLIFAIYGKVSPKIGVLTVATAILIAIVSSSLFDYLNKRISQKHRYYEKINKFQESHRVYIKIKEENAKSY